MGFIFKSLFRTAVIGTALAGAVVGGTAMVVGPERVGAMVEQVKADVTDRFDANLDDPTVLRRKLDEVAQKYPRQIAQVQRDLVEIREEAARLTHEREVSERVVALIDRDLAELTPALADARAEAAAVGARLASVPVRWDGGQMSARRATIRIAEIERERGARAAAAADAAESLLHLRAQEEHFEETLGRLLDEQAELNAKIGQIESEIATVARTERLIEMLEAREATLRNIKRFEVESLDGLTAVLERKRLEQTHRLEAIGATVESRSYAELAEAQLSLETAVERTEADETPGN